jgi:hypothetical protein
MTVDPKTLPSVSLRQEPNNGSGPQSSQQADNELPKGSTGRAHVWLLRIRALLFVTVCATFGVLLIILPWTSKWTDNTLLLSWPELRGFLSNGFVRGFCSGLGILDLWLGFWEAIYYHEKPVGSGQ